MLGSASRLSVEVLSSASPGPGPQMLGCRVRWSDREAKLFHTVTFGEFDVDRDGHAYGSPRLTLNQCHGRPVPLTTSRLDRVLERSRV